MTVKVTNNTALIREKLITCQLRSETTGETNIIGSPVSTMENAASLQAKSMEALRPRQLFGNSETIGWAVSGAAIGFTAGLLQFLSASAMKVCLSLLLC